MRITIDDNGEALVVGNGKQISLRDYVKQARKARGINRTQLTIMSGLSHPTYFKFESGQNNSIRTGLMALEAMGISPYIIGGPV